MPANSQATMKKKIKNCIKRKKRTLIYYTIFFCRFKLQTKKYYFTEQARTLPLSCVTGCVPSRIASRACTYNKFNCTGSLESIF